MLLLAIGREVGEGGHMEPPSGRGDQGVGWEEGEEGEAGAAGDLLREREEAAAGGAGDGAGEGEGEGGVPAGEEGAVRADLERGGAEGAEGGRGVRR